MTDHTSSCARSAGKVGHDLSLTVADYEDDCFMLQEFVKLMRKLEELTQSQVMEAIWLHPDRLLTNYFCLITGSTASENCSWSIKEISKYACIH